MKMPWADNDDYSDLKLRNAN